MEEIYEYELLNIEWNLEYNFSKEGSPLFVRDSSSINSCSEKETVIHTDADGIATGDTREDIKQRKGIIKNFWRDLKIKYPNPEIFKIHNLALDEDIFLRAISLDEALSHSAVSYNSTKAFLRLEDILAKARPVGRVEPKTDTTNQNDFEKLLIMTYEYEDIGRVKLTVGLRRRLKKDEVHQKIEYAITHLAEGVPLMPTKEKRKKKASHKK